MSGRKRDGKCTRKAKDVSVVNVRHYPEDLTLFNALVSQRAVCVCRTSSAGI
jgi:hypothetical protein